MFNIFSMIKRRLFLISLFGYLFANGQQIAYFNDGNGKPVYLAKTNFTEEGSPYFFSDYHLAAITTDKNIVFDSVFVKLNLSNGDIQYLDKDGKEMITLIPVKKIIFYSTASPDQLTSSVTLTSPYGYINQPGSGIYEVLDSGKIQLLNELTISQKDETRYGNAGVVRIYEKKTQLYFFIGNDKLQKADKNKKDILEIMSDKKGEIQDFIDKNLLNFRKDADILKIIHYYNSLHRQQ